MKKTYEKLYYRLYKFMLLIEGNNESTHLSAILLFSAIQLQNMFLILLISMYFGFFEGGVKIDNGEVYFFIFGIGVIFFNWLLIKKNEQYKKIIDRENHLGYQLSSIIIDLLMVTSIIFSFVFARLIDG